eukprot:8820290-Ditylum_brightwellii.AAC.1
MNFTLVGSLGGTGLARVDFTPDGKYVDVHACHISVEKDTTSYERFDIITGERLKTLAHNTTSDITGFVCNPQTSAVEIVMHDYEKPTMECIITEDEDNHKHEKDDKKSGDVKSSSSSLLRLELKSLSVAFPNMSVYIINRTLNDDIWVIYGEGDVGQVVCGGSPCGYFIYERHNVKNTSANPMPITVVQKQQEQQQQGPSLFMFCSPRPELAKYQLGPMAPVHITARDGEDILCYLSTPPPSTPNTGALVLIIHGGPQTRDY